MATTIAKSLRSRKTLAQKLAECQSRILRSAVIDEDRTEDFKVSDTMQEMLDLQAQLRATKTSVARASVNIMVAIPAEILGTDSIRDIPLYEAVLLRDDMKSRLSLVKQLVDMPTDSQRGYYREEKDPPKKKRTFDFDSVLKEVSNLQEWIDEVDARIQFADNTKEI